MRGIERADSIAFDMHKWMYLPYEIGCTLVRDGEVHRKAFTLTPDYLAHDTRGLAGSDLWFSDYGIQRQDLRKLAENSFYAMGKLFDLTPVKLTVDDATAIYERAYA